MMTVYIYSQKKTAHGKKLNGTHSYSFHCWLKTDMEVITAADVTQFKCSGHFMMSSIAKR